MTTKSIVLIDDEMLVRVTLTRILERAPAIPSWKRPTANRV